VADPSSSAEGKSGKRGSRYGDYCGGKGTGSPEKTWSISSVVGGIGVPSTASHGNEAGKAEKGKRGKNNNVLEKMIVWGEKKARETGQKGGIFLFYVREEKTHLSRLNREEQDLLRKKSIEKRC